MAREIINEESVVDVHRRMSLFIEETRSLLQELKKSVENAEMDGWRDKNYYMVQDQFEVAKKNITDGLNELDDMSMPIIKELMIDIDF